MVGTGIGTVINGISIIGGSILGTSVNACITLAVGIISTISGLIPTIVGLIPGIVGDITPPVVE